MFERDFRELLNFRFALSFEFVRKGKVLPTIAGYQIVTGDLLHWSPVCLVNVALDKNGETF
jgi:hypothetical protein